MLNSLSNDIDLLCFGFGDQYFSVAKNALAQSRILPDYLKVLHHEPLYDCFLLLNVLFLLFHRFEELHIIRFIVFHDSLLGNFHKRLVELSLRAHFFGLGIEV